MAESILAKMAVQISANTAELTRELNKTSGGIKDFQNNLIRMAGAVGIAFGIKEVAQFGFEVSKLAGEAEGVRKAFERLPESDKLMKRLKESTHETVSELDLMKRTVQAANFGISLQALPKLLEFAAQRAQQTGQSVDYLVDSIVTGIGRKSPLILDNLGISAVQLKKQLNGVTLEASSIADVADAVGRIASENLSTMGEFSENAATKVQRLSAEWDNLKVSIGEAANGTGAFATIITALTEELKRASGNVQQLSTDFGDRLASAISKAGKSNAASGALGATIEQLKELRAESGKPLEVDVTALIDKYKLSGDQADRLRNTILEINNTLTNQENRIQQFTNFAKGYKDINDAAEAYKGKIYQLIVAEEGHKQSLETLTPELEEEITAVAKNIQEYRDAIKIINDYVKSKTVATTATEEQTKALLNATGLLGQLEIKVKDFEDKRKKAFSVEEIAKFNEKIRETRDEIELLLAATPEQSNFFKEQLKNAEQGKTTEFKDLSKGDPTKGDESLIGTNLFPDTTEEANAQIENIKRVDETEAEWAERRRQRHEQQLDERAAEVESYVSYGQAIGNAISTSIQGQETAVQALKRVTSAIVQEFLRQALGAVIANAAKTPGPPPVGIALAVAGIAVISAMFSKIGGKGGGGSSGSVSSRPQTQTAVRNRIDTSKEIRVDFDAVFTFQQGALTAAVKSENTRNSRLNS